MSIHHLKTPDQSSSGIDKIKELYRNDTRRFWIVQRLTDEFKTHSFDMVFCREFMATITEGNPENHKLQTLVPLNEYLSYMDIDMSHADKLLEGFFTDNTQDLSVYNIPDVRNEALQIGSNKVSFITDELCYHSFEHTELVPIYMVNKQDTLTLDSTTDLVEADYYILLQHAEFIEFVFRSYSVFVKTNQFAKDGFLPVWNSYLTLMQANSTAKNLEEIHRIYWLSQCPEYAHAHKFSNSTN